MSNPNREDLRAAFLAFRRARGVAETKKVLRDLTGVDDLDAIPEEEWSDVIAKLNEGSAIPSGNPLDPSRIFARWNSQTRAPRDGG